LFVHTTQNSAGQYLLCRLLGLPITSACEKTHPY
jgi:hypothetical protein